VEGANGDGALPEHQRGGAAAMQYSGGTGEDQPNAYGEAGEPPAPGGSTIVEQRRVGEHEQLGRNDPCWCGSGKKYKKCHGA
jgi:preprotein translocase subunit SecA